MPMMDGIELIRAVRDEGRYTRFVIISGYAEFEYAEQALNMGVSGYILKPIPDNLLRDTFNNIIRQLEKEQDIDEERKKIKTLERDHKQLLLEQAVNLVFHTPEAVAGRITEEQMQLPVFNQFLKHILILIHIDSSNYYESNFKYEDLNLLKFAIRNILEELGAHEPITVVNNIKDVTQIFVVYSHHEEESLRKNCDRFVINVFTKINKYLKASITVAVSGVDGMSAEIYKQARAAFDMRLTRGSNQIYRYEMLETNQKITMPELKLKLLYKCIEMYDFPNVRVILTDIFVKDNEKGISGRYIRYLFSEIVNILVKICSRFNSESENFGEEITLKALAKKFAINPNYLSSIFRQYTGETLMKFVTDTRIEHACQLLRRSDAGIGEIAKAAGYEDIQYFYRVFKKNKGITPLEYRNHQS